MSRINVRCNYHGRFDALIYLVYDNRILSDSDHGFQFLFRNFQFFLRFGLSAERLVDTDFLTVLKMEICDV